MSINITRQIVLDTETTGINKFGIHYEGHRVIEIGAVEIINRRLSNNQFHVYLKPDRSIDLEAYHIHGISDQFLENQPTFAEIVNKFLIFIRNSELIIHNAPFDLGFLNHELKLLNSNAQTIESYCKIIDSLKLAQKIFPGQRNNLDILCERYFINNSKRTLHNALVDAQLLANVFLSMTGGQTKIQFVEENMNGEALNNNIYRKQYLNNMNNFCSKSLKIIYANATEKIAHEECLDLIQIKNKYCLWKKLNKR